MTQVKTAAGTQVQSIGPITKAQTHMKAIIVKEYNQFIVTTLTQMDIK